MSTHKDDYLKAKEKGKAQEVSINIFTFKEQNQCLIGTLLDIQPFTGGKFEQQANQYLIDTDEGQMSTVLGSATDKTAMTKIMKGDNIAITFLGKGTLDGGGSFNKFRVEKF